MVLKKGSLACGTYNIGRMSEPEFIYKQITTRFNPPKTIQFKKLKNTKILVTAGATREYIDPFRFISNPSSGKMGVEIAKSFYNKGLSVEMVCGYTNIVIPNYIPYIRAESYQSIYDEINKKLTDIDVLVMTCAISDYKVKNFSKIKIKTNSPIIEFKKNKDIIKEFAKKKLKNQIFVGFAAESENIIENAKKKLKNKNLDLIIANQIGGENTGFESNFNTAFIIDKDNVIDLGNLSKHSLAEKIVNIIQQKISALP